MNSWTPAHTAYTFCIGLCEQLDLPCHYKLNDKSRKLFNLLMWDNYLPTFDEFATALSFIFDRRMDFTNEEEKTKAQSKLIDWYIRMEKKYANQQQ